MCARAQHRAYLQVSQLLVCILAEAGCPVTQAVCAHLVVALRVGKVACCLIEDVPVQLGRQVCTLPCAGRSLSICHGRCLQWQRGWSGILMATCALPETQAFVLGSMLKLSIPINIQDIDPQKRMTCVRCIHRRLL